MNFWRLSFFLVSLLLTWPLAASETKTPKQEEEFNPSEAIIEHVTDAHEWHIFSLEDKHFSIPLPIILIDNGSLVVFSSSRFAHGESYKGYAIAHEGPSQGKIVKVDNHGKEIEGASMPLDFSITKITASLFMVSAILLVTFLFVARAFRKRAGMAPKGMQSFFEVLIQFVIKDIAIPNIGEKHYARFVPYLLTLFFFILFNNIMGLIPFFPGGANVTGNIAITFTLAFFTLIIVNVNANKGYWRHVFAAPGVPFWLLPIMIPVEIIGILSKPFALMVRLFANITAGHIIVLSLVSLIFIFKTIYIAPVSVAFVLFMDVLELLVAALQAYIFTLLTSLFIGMAVAEPEHH